MSAGVLSLASTFAAPRTVDARGFKQAMRSFADAVAILACEDGEQGCCGLTATAVCSFSAEPPSLLACINQKSTLAALLREGSVFSVNLPAADQEHVARAFGGLTVARGAARFAAGSWVRGDHGAPLLAGARVIFECAVGEIIPRASHLIVIGLVLSVRLDRAGRAPLLHAEGRFATGGLA